MHTSKIVDIVNCGIGNAESVSNALRKMQIRSRLLEKPDDVEKADILIIPGIGHFDSVVYALQDQGFWPYLQEAILKTRTPTIGICVGAQLMCKGSDEGDLEGLGVFDTVCRDLKTLVRSENTKIPHMGWNLVGQVDGKPSYAVQKPEYGEERYYFAHKYAIPILPETILSVKHGAEFSACLKKDNVIAAQFHPEKSHVFGLNFLKNAVTGLLEKKEAQ